MTKSRTGPAVAALLLLASAAASAQTVTAEQAMENHRLSFPTVREIDCPTDAAADEVVVCARRGPDPNRMPMPSPAPGRRILGEAAGTTEAMRVGDDPCTTVGPNQRCGGGLPVIPILMTVGKALVKAVDGED